jgi:glycerophosphoryl diester phosphodiesterase
MTAFQGAVDLGFTWIETDLHVTRDGVIVCFHDDTLGRTTDRSGRVVETSTGTSCPGPTPATTTAPSTTIPFRGRGSGSPGSTRCCRPSPTSG